MGLNDVRRQAISALEAGRIQHEIRGEIDVKNLLLVGDVTSDQVIRLLKACKGTGYSASPHHTFPGVDVHVFKPVVSLEPGGKRERWYIKLYFLEPDVWFISVHKSEEK